MKNDPCRKLLPPGVNRFVEKGPLKPEKNKRASEASDKKSHKIRNDPCRKSLTPQVNKFFQKGPLKPKNNKKQKRASEEKSH